MAITLGEAIKRHILRNGRMFGGTITPTSPCQDREFFDFLQKRDGEIIKPKRKEEHIGFQTNSTFSSCAEDIEKAMKKLQETLGKPKKKERKKGNSKTLIKFLKNKKGERVGVFVAYRPIPGGDIGTGWSLCNKKDEFSTMEAMRLAYDRMFKPYVEIPPSIKPSFIKFADRAEIFFEGGMECFLPIGRKSFTRFYNSLPEDLKKKIQDEGRQCKPMKTKNKAVKYYRGVQYGQDNISFSDQISKESSECMSHFKVTVETVQAQKP